MTIEERAREFCEGAFGPFGVNIEPYAKIVSELLQGAADQASTEAFQQVGNALKQSADEYPMATAYVLAGIGAKLSTATKESLMHEGLVVLAEEVIADPQG